VVEVKDARSLSPEGQEALRKRAVRVVLSGMKQTTAARAFGVARGMVARWMHEHRPPAPKLTGEQEEAIVTLMETHSPDQLGLPGSLWTRGVP
jgi:transposase